MVPRPESIQVIQHQPPVALPVPIEQPIIIEETKKTSRPSDSKQPKAKKARTSLKSSYVSSTSLPKNFSEIGLTGF